MFVVMHIGNNRSVLPALLTHPTARARFATNGELIQEGNIYVAPPDQHMVLDRTTIWLSKTQKVHATRPAADPLFVSASDAFGDRVVGVVLSGGDGDGAQGLKRIKERNGTALVQDPDEAAKTDMPRSAVAADHPDAWLPTDQLAIRIADICLSADSQFGDRS